MSMMDVARFLHYSKSIDHVRMDEQVMNLSMANSGRLFWSLQADRNTRGTKQSLGFSNRAGSANR